MSQESIMETRKTILQELENISAVVAKVGNTNIYTVPANYFDNLLPEILAKIKLETLLKEGNVNPYSTPNGYFNGLAENILVKAKTSTTINNEVIDELKEIAPTLNTITKQEVYIVPNGYFENIKTSIPTKQTSKIVMFGKPKKWFSYAAAALVVGILAFGGIKYMQANNNAVVYEKIVEKTSNEEIQQYLETHPATEIASTHTNTEDNSDGTGLFEGTSEEELHQYLKEQPSIVENNNKEI